jgi:hypothetical protein
MMREKGKTENKKSANWEGRRGKKHLQEEGKTRYVGSKKNGEKKGKGPRKKANTY